MRTPHSATATIAVTVALLAAAAIPAAAAPSRSAAASQPVGSVVLLSHAPDGWRGKGMSLNPAISADGRFTAYTSVAPLVADDTNRMFDAYVWDADTDTNTLVTRGYDGSPADAGTIYRPSITADGRYVTYSSLASNLAPADPSDQSDVFLTDMSSGQTTLVSVSKHGVSGNSDSYQPSISPDGQFVVFTSDATDLVPHDPNGHLREIFLYDVASGETTLITNDATGGGADGGSDVPAISADDSVIVFHSTASDLVAEDTNGAWDVFAYDIASGATSLVSVAADGGGANDLSRAATVSADGNLVSYTSLASNLVPSDANDTADIFVTNRTTGVTRVLTTTKRGQTANGSSRDGAISADGRSVVFLSAATNLPAPGRRHIDQAYEINLATGELHLVSSGFDNRPGGRKTDGVAVSADGAYVAFSSKAKNLTTIHYLPGNDVFRYRDH